MSKEWDQLEQLFQAALELPSAQERADFLAQACGAELALRQRVEKLLHAHETAGQFLNPETPPWPSDLPCKDGPCPPTEQPGEHIGHYTLIERIGEGGCCVVYRAEQTAPVRRQVALKLIKAGMDTRQVVARFDAERQALALMDHPHIAKVFDAGVTGTGRPYFVMELVQGIPITQYCDQHRLSIKQRLELFLQVGHAVHHAHQKGIIHRDLKPSNILVVFPDGRSSRHEQAEPDVQRQTPALNEKASRPSSRDDRSSTTHAPPFPKIIDFGIAKAMQAPLTDKPFVTWFGQFVGTPAYMSPEQARMSGDDVDARTDVYSLGALLYELLTQRQPFDAEALLQAGLEELLHVVRTREPPIASTRFGALARSQQEAIAARRQSTPAALRTALQGDLDSILAKTIEKDPDRRYDSASALVEDVRRHLLHEPVQAMAPRLGYRFQKFVRRNWAAVVGVTSVVLALMAGTAMSTWQAVRAHRLAREALAREHQAEAAQREAENALTDIHAARGLAASERGEYAQAMLWFAQTARTCVRDPDRTAVNVLRVRLWEGHTVLPVRALQGPSQLARLEFSPDGQSLLAFIRDDYAYRWDWKKETLSTNLPLPFVAPLDPSRALQYPAAAEVTRLQSQPNPSRLTSAAPGVGLSGSGRVLTSSDGQWLALLLPDGRVEIRSATNHALLHRLTQTGDAASGNPIGQTRPHRDSVLCLVFSRDSRTLLTGSADRTAKLWSVPDGHLRYAPLAHYANVTLGRVRPGQSPCGNHPSRRPDPASGACRNRAQLTAASPVSPDPNWPGSMPRAVT